MPARIPELVRIALLATLVTATVAAPVLLAPSDRIFGSAIVGRHHDPFTAMRRFAAPVALGVYSQPVTDLSGAALTRWLGPVAAYNAVVLLSFPLAAVAAFMLARYLALSTASAAFAAMAYAFSPFHVAQAAYHPHVAQTHWVALYFLALLWFLERSSVRSLAGLSLAAAAVTLSNFYAGFIVAVVTPVAVAASLVLTPEPTRRRGLPGLRLASIAAGLGIIALSGLLYVWYAAAPVLQNVATFAFPRADLSRYSAVWWSYLVPPVAHPLLGASARRLWSGAAVHEGLVEQQVGLGWTIIALAALATAAWVRHNPRPAAPLSRVPMLLALAATAFVCSLAPDWQMGTVVVSRPSAWLFGIAPMFRAYARFGVVVQLMMVLLAAIGLERLCRARVPRMKLVCVGLVGLASFEYGISPAAQWQDVLPTKAHRWVMQQHPAVDALDCVPPTQESGSVPWLTADRIKPQDAATTGCADPNLFRTLTAARRTHAIVRHDSSAGRWLSGHTPPDGLRPAASFTDATVLAMREPAPQIFTRRIHGMLPREQDETWWWMWMGNDAAWTVVNDGPDRVTATLTLELSAFHQARDLEVGFHGGRTQTITVRPDRGFYRLGPFELEAGAHTMSFHAVAGATIADSVTRNGDRRRLSVAVGAWNWDVREGAR